MLVITRILEAFALGGLFMLCFRFPTQAGQGYVEAIFTLLFPILVCDVAYQGRKAAWLLLAFALGFGGLFYWVPGTLEIQAPMPYPLALTAAALLIAWESLGLLAVSRLARFGMQKNGPWAAACLAALGITVWELLAFHVYHWNWGSALGGLPWMSRSAAFLGAPGLSAWLWGGGAFIAGLRMLPIRSPLPGRLTTSFGIYVGLPAALSAAWYLLPKGPVHTLDAVMIQPNFDPGKRFPGMEAEMWKRTDAFLLQKQLPRPERPTLVLWPESAVMGRNDLIADRLPEANQRNVAWLFGTEGWAGEDWYNLVRGQAPGCPPFIQAKVEPMNFGERMPGPEILRKWLDQTLGYHSQAKGRLGTGSSLTLATPCGALRVHPLICNEALMPWRTSRGLQAAGGDLLSNHTNDGWFGRSIATDLHAAQLRLRAVEMGMPLLRVTLTGKSGLFLADGQWQLWGNARTEGAYHVPLVWQNRKTPVKYSGFYWYLLGFCGLSSLAALRRKSTNQATPGYDGD